MSWAQDLVQESFAKLWVNRSKVTTDHAPPFLYKVLYNKMIDDRRKNSRTQLLEKLPEPVTHRQDLEHKDLLEKAFDQLKETEKQIIMLRDWEGYSYEEIGKIMDLKESSVKVGIFRARKKMQSIITKLNQESPAHYENHKA
jgi:RNA polymerase sigma-70 factor (ECF subfamily)